MPRPAGRSWQAPVRCGRTGSCGVHLDLEPLHSDNADYLRLLDRLGPAVRDGGGLLSVAVHQIDPLPGLHTVSGAVTGHRKWISQRFFGQVARRVDQIALMSYDTGMPAESLYGGYVAQQTRLALEATGPDTDLLMGLPFFHTDGIGHHASAETVRAAVRGIRLGLTREGPGHAAVRNGAVCRLRRHGRGLGRVRERMGGA